MVNTIRTENDAVLLVDCGGFFSDRYISETGKLIARKGLEAASSMGYAVMNIGTGELAFGVDFLREQSSALTFPLVASNLSYAEGITPFTKKYVMAQAGGLKVAILGVMPTGILEKMPRDGTSGVVEVIPPDEALASLLPGIRQEADMVILLSQLGQEWTQYIVDTVKGIDLAIYGGKGNAPLGCGENVQTNPSADEPRVPVLKASARGSYLGHVRLSVDTAGRVTTDSTKMISLDESAPMDEAILAITGTEITKLAAEEQKKAAEEQKREIEELQKLTPEEYMRRLLREQKGEKKQ
jgi:2',3'-cyclic-nucleotide 2'-phosphodiesterase (5'-nucleotidase family)